MSVHFRAQESRPALGPGPSAGISSKEPAGGGTLGRKGAFSTVGAQFRVFSFIRLRVETYLTLQQQLNDLIRALASTTPSFVRCLKPHPSKTPGGFDRVMMQAQLKYSGMLETVRIRKAGYGARMNFIDFYDRYEQAIAYPERSAIYLY